MNSHPILLPMITLVAWTFAILLIIPFRRFRGVFRGDVTAEDFRLGESANVPAEISLPNRNYMSLLELPLLFYVVILAQYVTQTDTSVTVDLCWTYVGLRVLHSLVHLTYNHVLHRFTVFALSNVVLLIIWVLFSVAVITI
ncbi:hypothetical protein SAMN03080615_02453 [Amphritea atlantica]|uniref:MAPEG family protein n=1 Tax=Amphritea atlantica TaxID=355243 RepID=A0A1H9I5Y8_9GAMM|nr:MAPEG family protein [Amphritea atlantica]SEQ69999.1 hypothetical protein SAMN03080615_02453 [Amphritea atlantica]